MVPRLSIYFLIQQQPDQRLPGGRAPRAMPRPLTGAAGGAWPPSSPSLAAGVDWGSSFASGWGVASACGAGSGVAGAAGAAVFLAPGRLAPAAIPRPLTGAAGALAAGAAVGS